MALLAITVAVSTGCTEAPTRLVTRIDSDLAPCSELRRVLVVAQRENGPEIGRRELDLCALSLRYPGEVAIAPKDLDDSRRVILTVTGTVTGTAGAADYTLRQEFVTPFQRGRTMVVRYSLVRACAADPCPTGFSCVPGPAGEARCASRETPVVVTATELDRIDGARWADATLPDRIEGAASAVDVTGDLSNDLPLPDAGGHFDAGEISVVDAPVEDAAGDAAAVDEQRSLLDTFTDDRVDVYGGADAAPDRTPVSADMPSVDRPDTSVVFDVASPDAGTDTRIVEVAMGSAHVCVLRDDARVRCWGSNDRGQIGSSMLSIGTDAIRTAVAPSLPDLPVRAVYAGGNRTCAILEDTAVDGGERRRLFCWGENASGQLGDGTIVDRSTPLELVGYPAGDMPESAALGGPVTCARMRRGGVFCWGIVGLRMMTPRDTPARLQDDSDRVRELAATSSRVCMIRDGATASLWCTVVNGTPTPVDALMLPGGAATWESLSAGGSRGGAFCAVRREDGALWCWGENDSGQLGNGSRTSVAFGAMSQVPIPDARAIAMGREHSCAIAGSTGTVWCWGLNSLEGTTTLDPDNSEVGGDLLATGERSLGFVTSPRLVLSRETGVDMRLAGVARLSAGGDMTCALSREGELRCWGRPSRGSDGSGFGRDYSPWALTVAGVEAARDVAVGSRHACLLNAAGSVRCWGYGADHELGNGSRIDLVPSPRSVTGSATFRSIETYPANNLTCGLASDGVRCWGLNQVLVRRDSMQWAAAEQRSDTTMARGIFENYPGICVFADGAPLVCLNRHIGGNACPMWTGSSDPCAASRPHYPFPLDGRVIGYGAGGNFCVLTEATGDGGAGRALRCSCQNDYGQLGFSGGSCNLTGDTVATVRLRTGELIRDVAVGSAHVCLVNSQGVPECSGDNRNGQLGISPTTTARTSFAMVPALRDQWLNPPAGESSRESDRIWSFGDRVCARVVPDRDLSRSELWCWGANLDGALGAGHNRFNGQPAPVLAPDGIPVRGIVDVSLGPTSCAVLTGGHAVCWGTNTWGQLGADVSPIVTRPQRSTLPL